MEQATGKIEGQPTVRDDCGMSGKAELWSRSGCGYSVAVFVVLSEQWTSFFRTPLFSLFNDVELFSLYLDERLYVTG